MLTDTETKVIKILLEHEITPDAFGSPILAVDRAMTWSTKESTRFVDDLIERKLVSPEALGRTGYRYDSKWRWQKGESFDEATKED